MTTKKIFDELGGIDIDLVLEAVPCENLEDTTMKTNFDNLYVKLSGTYREENGYLIPDIALPEQTDYQIGKYGRMHLVYIKQHRRGRH